MCPLCEPCVQQAALCCSLFIYVYNTEISVFWVLGTSTTLHLQSLFLLTIAKERASCPAFMNTSVCFENYFYLPQLFPLQFEDYFFLFPLLGYSASGSPFSFSWKETHVTHEGTRKKLPIQTGTKGSCCDASQQTRCWEAVRYFSITGGRVHGKQLIQIPVPPPMSILCKPIHYWLAL